MHSLSAVFYGDVAGWLAGSSHAGIVSKRLIVEAVRATLRSFGSDSSKSTKFGPDIPYIIPFPFFEGAKKSDTRVAILGKSNMAASHFSLK